MCDFVHAQCLDIVPLHTVENKQFVVHHVYVASVLSELELQYIDSQGNGEKTLGVREV